MPITEADITQYVDELGLSDAARTQLIAELKADDARATKFVGQRMRHDDYTRKTQAISTERTNYENTVRAYEQRLGEANSKVAKIMKDFENEQISRATAEARLQKVKTTYDLTDDDIPAVSSPAAVTPAATAVPVDIDAKLASFRNDLMKSLAPELLALPTLTAMQNEISYQHQDLTGKRLTQAEMIELMNDSRTNKTDLQTAWERKYGIGDIRINRTVEERVNARLKEEEDKRIAANSEAALASVRSNQDDFGVRQTPILKHKFETHAEVGQKPDPAKGQQDSGPKMSGAERAAARYMTRRANGIPLGAPEPKKAA